jgi:uncharacterized protein
MTHRNGPFGGRFRETGVSTVTRRSLSFWTAALLLCLSALASAQQQPRLEDLSAFPRTDLDIKGGGTSHHFSVWVADTPARQEQGLMFVRDLAPDQGMLFPNCCSGIWMKNTYIELDIVFVGGDGHIIKIAPRARPFDETTITPGGTPAAVIELKGGQADVLKLHVGDQVSWKPFAAAKSP